MRSDVSAQPQRRLGHGAAAVAFVPEVAEPEREARSVHGRFTKGNRFATGEYRARVKRDLHYYINRSGRDTVAKLKTGKMQPGVAMALVALFRLQLELIDRSQTTATLESMQHEIDSLSTRLRDLLASQADRGAH